MKRTPSLTVLALLALPSVSVAQQPQPASALAAAMRTIWTRASANMPAAADDMPVEKFTFKPTPQQMSFAEIIAHEADANQTLCAALAGGQSTPTESTAGASAPKEQLVARLRQSFDYCGNVILQINETMLGDSIPFFGGRKNTRARAVVALAQDWADHYAQAAMYLRLNGILPPSARPRR
jgi:hypothetical protein